MDYVLDPTVVWSARLLLAVVFATAALGKLRALDEFTGVVHNYRIPPEPLVRPTALVLPPFELLVALCLLLEPTRSLAATAAAALLFVFALAMAINLVRGRVDIDCGCFAASLKQRIGWGLVGRNAVLIALALLAIPDGLAARSWSWLDVVTAAGATTTALLLYLAYTQLESLTPPRSGERI